MVDVGLIDFKYRSELQKSAAYMHDKGWDCLEYMCLFCVNLKTSLSVTHAVMNRY